MDPHLEPAGPGRPQSSTLAARHLSGEKEAVLGLRNLEPAYATREDREAMLRDAELKKAITKVLERRVPEPDIEDLMQVTLLAAFKAKQLPAAPAKRRQYILGIARNKAAAHRRCLQRAPRVEKEAKVDEIGPAASGGSSMPAADLIEHHNLFTRIVVDLPTSHLQTLEWLARTVMGDSFAEIAREASLHEDVVRKRVHTLHRRIIAAAAAFAFVLVLGGFWYALRPKPPIADHPKPEPTTMAPARPASSTQPPQSQLEPEPQPSAPAPQTPHEMAAPFREEGLAACAKRDWATCLTSLERAKEIDPDGDPDPAVQAARKKAVQATKHAYDDQPPVRQPRRDGPVK